MEISEYTPLTEHFTGRLLRSIQHPLRLLHRSNSDFYILGATGNVYTVTLSTTPTCDCPDAATPCKHILFVYIRLLSLPLDDPCLRRRTLPPCQLTRLLSAQVSHEPRASASTVRRFHELYSRRNEKRVSASVESGSTCPVCLDEMGVDGRRLIACGACRNAIHEKCLMEWKSKGTRTCVICRATWRDGDEEDDDTYINLSAYVSDEDESIAHVSGMQDDCDRMLIGQV